LKCTLTIVSKSTCQLTDIDCIKGNEKLLDDLSACVKASCKPKEALSRLPHSITPDCLLIGLAAAKKFLSELMDAPIRNKTQQGTITTLVAGILSLVAYILRVVARLPWFGGNWGIDDWVMTAAIILIIPLTICAYLLNQIGLGTDMWLVSFENITKILEVCDLSS
jgi:hypothetical protein